MVEVTPNWGKNKIAYRLTYSRAGETVHMTLPPGAAMDMLHRLVDALDRVVVGRDYYEDLREAYHREADRDEQEREQQQGQRQQAPKKRAVKKRAPKTRKASKFEVSRGAILDLDPDHQLPH